MSLTYQWERCNASGASCVDISGETSTAYTLAAADVGSTIRVRVNDGVNNYVSLPTTIISAVTDPSYTSLTNWPRPTFTPTRTVNFTTAAGLTSALSGMTDGDLIRYTGTGTISISGEYTLFCSHTPATGVVIDLGLPSVLGGNNYVKFTGPGAGQNLPAVYIHDSKNLTIYGGDVSNAGNGGIRLLGGASAFTDNFHWWDFYVHGIGGNGIEMYPVSSPGATSGITNCSLRGEVTQWGLDTSFDPHAVKGTGLHGAQLIDVNVNGTTFTGNTIALYAHDGPSGCGMQFGNPNAATISGNTLYVKAANLTFADATVTAGSGLQFWGSVALNSTVVGWVEVSNVQGKGVETEGVSGAGIVDGGRVTVLHGRATNFCQNTALFTQADVWDTRHGVTYNDQVPA